MFKRLRNQFIIMHMSVVTIIIILFFGAILLFAHNGINRNINEMVSRNRIVVSSGMSRPDVPTAFMVNISANNEVLNIVSPFSMSDEFYISAVEQAVSKRRNIGRIKIEGLNLAYRFNGSNIVFLDISREISMFNNLVYTFLWIALPLLFIIFLASLYFANHSIRPIESAFVKQKEFVADASHELKTPLTTISANADVLLSGAEEHSKKWATHIKTETGRMKNLVENLLYLAKVDYEDNPQFASMNLGDVLSDVMLPLEALIHEQKVDLQVNCADGVIINGDRAQIHRLLGILIDNAIKYTDGKISVNIGKISNRAQITVQNSGEPIPPEKLDKLFDRFYRADESHQYTGSFGLGLSIAKAIVDRHKGEIFCKSDETNGTKFTVRF